MLKRWFLPELGGTKRVQSVPKRRFQMNGGRFARITVNPSGTLANPTAISSLPIKFAKR